MKVKAKSKPLIEKGVNGEHLDVYEALQKINPQNMYAAILEAAQRAKEIAKTRDRYDQQLGYIKHYKYKPLNQALAEVL
jgi:hypothetical protein